MARKRVFSGFTIDTIVSTYQKKAGNISATCVALNNTSRTTFYKWRNESEELNRRLKEVEESLVDFTESKLLEQIQEGNMTAIIFHLKTKGKSRGYIETTEIDADVKTDLDMSGLSDEELTNLQALLKKAKK